MLSSSPIIATAAAALMVLGAGAASAQSEIPGAPDIADLLAEQGIGTGGQSANRFPSVFGAPSAVAGGAGGFVAATLVNPRGGISGNDTDGSLAGGYTFGDAASSVSVTAGVAITSLTDSFGDSGSLFFSVSRQLGSSSYIGASVGNVAAWGDGSDTDESYSIQYSYLNQTGSIPMQYTLAYGNRTTYDDDGSGDIGEGFVVGVGAGVSETLSLSASATHTQVNLGMGISVPSVPNLGITAGIYDAFDSVDRQQFSLTVAFSF